MLAIYTLNFVKRNMSVLTPSGLPVLPAHF